jgi:hypothetical protein
MLGRWQGRSRAHKACDLADPVREIDIDRAFIQRLFKKS